jgi:tetratricopeptide (TPR) repeat protein
MNGGTVTRLRIRRGYMLAAILWVAQGRAETPPSSWQIAREPRARARWELHMRVQELMHPARVDDASWMDERAAQDRRLEDARQLLEGADVTHGADARLIFDLGMVYEQLATLEHDTTLHRKVVETLAPAVARFADDPAVPQALDALVYAYAKLDRPQEELATWREYIQHLLDDRARLAPMMNMGEAEMRLGLLEEAVDTFRATLDLCQSLPNSSFANSTYALTLWDMSVALDRSGDPAGAVQTAAKARGWTWARALTGRKVTGWDEINDDEEVFFVPEWEREWYLALGETASATSASDPHDAAMLWAKAERHWDEYLTRASAEALRDTAGRALDRWVAVARRRRDHAHSARLAAERRPNTRAASEPVRPVSL